jgi:broad specificity phosphatase PhoE
MKIFFVRHAVTQANIDRSFYSINDNKHSITKHGELQAIETGKYLKTFGKFDLIISSPRLRTIQTAKIISLQLNYKNKIILNDLLAEEIYKLSENYPKYEDFNKYLENKKKKEFDYYNKLKQLVKEETNPFKKIELTKKLYIIRAQLMEITDEETKIKISIKFLNQLKKLKNKCILIVTHGGELDRYQKLITNTLYTNFVISNQISDDNKYFGSLNCCIMGCLLYNNKFTLVIPSNCLHLKKLIEKNSQLYKKLLD